jgi:citrate lyase beta subunit
MQRSLSDALVDTVAGQVAAANTRFQQRYPGDSTARQPVHTVYGGAQLFKAGTAARLGALALASLDEYAPDFATFARALGLPGAAELPTDRAATAALAETLAGEQPGGAHAQPQAWLAWLVYERVRDKLQREPVEDPRVDFEDGYGHRADAEEDRHAVAVAEQLAQGLAQGSLPAFVGLRIKSFSPESFRRSARTLDLVMTSLAARAGRLPDPFIVTLPKITVPEHVAALADLLDAIEAACGIAPGTARIDAMIEAPQMIAGEHGGNSIGKLIQAGRGRVLSAALGVFDYTASSGIAAHEQSYTHPAAEFARLAMQAALAGTGVHMSDSVTTIMPIGPHRAVAGAPLSPEQREANHAAVHGAWRLHHDNIRHSLRRGIYQGWDLHPAQLPVRYAAVYAFFLESLPEATQRLRAFIERAAQATLVGNTFDDAATGQGLLNFFLRGIACGALTESEALATGITLEELRGRSFATIAANRTRA